MQPTMKNILFIAIFAVLWTSCELGLRIMGGRNALQGEFPYIVSLEYKKSRGLTNFNYGHTCTGAALTSVWVLSAAHCVDESEPFTSKKEMFVRYNSYFPNVTGSLVPAIETITHPGYITAEGAIKRFDILLVRCFEMNIFEYGRINAVEYTSLVGYEAYSLGLGNTDAASFEKPAQVLKGMLYKCTDREIKLTSHMICLSRPCTVASTICGGDSGGPVLQASRIVGVHSMAFDDCDEYTLHLKNSPGTSAAIISPVSPVIDWITNNVRAKTTQ